MKAVIGQKCERHFMTLEGKMGNIMAREKAYNVSVDIAVKCDK